MWSVRAHLAAQELQLQHFGGWSGGGSLRQLREGRWTEATTLKSKPYRTRDDLQRMAKVIAATGPLLPSTNVNKKKKNLNFSKVSFQSG